MLTIAGGGANNYDDHATGTSAGFNQPTGTAFGAGATLLYLCDASNHRIRTIGTSATYAVATWVGPTGGKTGFAGRSFDLTHSLSLTQRARRAKDPQTAQRIQQRSTGRTTWPSTQ